MPPMRAGFSFMWFWGFVLLLIIGYTLFGEREQRPIDGDWNLVSELVEKGYVERINVLDKEKATVFLTEEAQKALADDDRFKNLPTTGAHIRFNTGGDVQYFAEQIEKAEAEAAEQGVPFGIVDLSLAPTPAIGDSVALLDFFASSALALSCSTNSPKCVCIDLE